MADFKRQRKQKKEKKTKTKQTKKQTFGVKEAGDSNVSLTGPQFLYRA